MSLRKRFWGDLAFATVAGVLAMITAVWTDWVEIVFRIDPDNSSGRLEWTVVVVLALVAVVSYAQAWREYHRARLHEA
jgi:hypothetical protein